MELHSQPLQGQTGIKRYLQVILGATLYCLWRETNRRKFSNCRVIAGTLARDILKKVRKHLRLVLNMLTDSTRSRLICNFLNISAKWRKKEKIWCRWDRPVEDKVILNADGAISDNGYGLGGLLRSNQSHLIICYSGKVSIESVVGKS